MNAIEIKHLHFLRHKRTIFTDLSLTLKQGQLIALLGPNGAGKSTLLKLICGLLSPQSGTINVYNRPIKSLSSLQRAQQLSYMPQFTDIQAQFTVEQVVSMGRFPHKKRFSSWTQHDHAIVAEAMRIAEIEHLKHRYMPNLSGGERQLVYLAKAIAQDTPILLLDEPTSDLDIYHQIIVTQVLKNMLQLGKTIVAAIHDINLAARISDTCLIVKDGKVVSYGTQEEVIQPHIIKQGFNVKSHMFQEPYSKANHIVPYEAIK